MVLVGVVILAIVIGQLIIQYDLNSRHKDTGIITLAGQQRMLSQRLTKVALYIQEDTHAGILHNQDLDTLRTLADTWKSSHYKLLKLIEDTNLPLVANTCIDSLLELNTPRVIAIHQACLPTQEM